MRVSRLVLSITLSAVLWGVSCKRSDTPRDNTAARQAGRDAYHATQEIKRGAKQAAKEIRNAGKEMREGWNDAKRTDPARRDK